MAFTESDRAAAEQALRRLSEYNDELLMRGMERLGQLGSTLSPTPPDRYWPTTAALMSWHGQQKRAIGAGLGALHRLTRRVGANGVSRYPVSEWGEPVALVSWMKRVRGRPAPMGIPAGERGVDGADGQPGEPCPNCPGGPMEMTTRANAFGGKQVRKTFGRCRHCELVIDATETWGGVEEVSAGTAEKGPAVAAHAGATSSAQPGEDGRPYFDELAGEWHRRVGDGVPMLVAGPNDMSDRQRKKDRDCWACAMAPHSLAYHDMKIAEAVAEHGIRRVEEDGRVRVKVPDEPE